MEKLLACKVGRYYLSTDFNALLLRLFDESLMSEASNKRHWCADGCHKVLYARF